MQWRFNISWENNSLHCRVYVEVSKHHDKKKESTALEPGRRGKNFRICK